MLSIVSMHRHTDRCVQVLFYVWFANLSLQRFDYAGFNNTSSFCGCEDSQSLSWFGRLDLRYSNQYPIEVLKEHGAGIVICVECCPDYSPVCYSSGLWELACPVLPRRKLCRLQIVLLLLLNFHFTFFFFVLLLAVIALFLSCRFSSCCRRRR